MAEQLAASAATPAPRRTRRGKKPVTLVERVAAAKLPAATAAVVTVALHLAGLPVECASAVHQVLLAL